MYVYDTVHFWAEALSDVEATHGHGSYQNGSLLRESIAAQNYMGATGYIEFSKLTQDRLSFADFAVRDRTAVIPKKIVGSYNSDPLQIAQGISPVTIDFGLLGWDEAIPQDGSRLAAEFSSLSSVPEILAVDKQEPTVLSLRNGFRELVLPETNLPAGVQLELLTAASMPVGDGVATWEFKPNFNGTDAFTTVLLTVHEPGEFLIAASVDGITFRGSMVPVSVVADGEGKDATSLVYLVVGSLVGFTSIAGLVYFVWKHPEQAKLLLKFMLELVHVVIGVTVRIADMVTDVMSGVAVMEMSELNHIAPWYITVLVIAGTFFLVEIYYMFAALVQVKQNIQDMAHHSIMNTQLRGDKIRREKQMAVLSVLNCIVEDVLMAIMNTMIIMRLGVDAALLFEISLFINALMMGWKVHPLPRLTSVSCALASLERCLLTLVLCAWQFGDVRVIHLLRRERLLLAEYHDVATRVQTASEHAQMATDELSKDLRRESVLTRLMNNVAVVTRDPASPRPSSSTRSHAVWVKRILSQFKKAGWRG